MKTVLKTVILMLVIVIVAICGYIGICVATGNNMPLQFIQGIVSGKDPTSSAISAATGGTTDNALDLLSSKFGLSEEEKSAMKSVISDLGVDPNNSAEVNEMINKNLDKADEIKNIADQMQSGQLSKSEAESKLSSILTK